MISSQKRKQRKRMFNAPLHKRQKLISSRLSEKLSKEYGRRSLGIKVGDSVQVMRGDHKGIKGKILSVDLKKYKVQVDSVKRRKTDGTEVHVSIHPSNLMITDALMNDKKRANIITRSGGKATVTKEEPKKEEKKTDTSAQKIAKTTKEISEQAGTKLKDYAE